ncbi:MAG TPA: hypothetical protein VNM14_16835 [Planctomycetota bacterium]|jgi:hypothetical protein|nr:hypothetical protein [Planctomycetota bacterium]
MGPAQSNPEYSIAYNIGLGVGMLLPLILALAAAKTLSGPDRNRKCALSVALMMGAWFLCSFGYALSQWTGFAGLQRLFVFIAAPVILGAGILAILGLIEVVGSKRPVRGSWQGITSLVIVGIFGLALVGGFVAGATKAMAARQIPKDWRMSQAPPGSQLDFPAKNFKYTVPREDWVQVVPQKLNAQADLAFVDPAHKLYFMVLAYKIAPGAERSQEKYLEIARNELKGLDPGAVVGESQPESLGALAGDGFSVDATLQNQSFTYREWIGVHGDHVYQLVAWGLRSNRAAVQPAAAGLFQNFGVIAP